MALGKFLSAIVYRLLTPEILPVPLGCIGELSLKIQSVNQDSLKKNSSHSWNIHVNKLETWLSLTVVNNRKMCE